MHRAPWIDTEGVNLINVGSPALLKSTLGAGVAASFPANREVVPTESQHPVRTAFAVSAHRERDVCQEVLMAARAVTEAVSIAFGAKRHRRRVMECQQHWLALESHQGLQNMRFQDGLRTNRVVVEEAVTGLQLGFAKQLRKALPRILSQPPRHLRQSCTAPHIPQPRRAKLPVNLVQLAHGEL